MARTCEAALEKVHHRGRAPVAFFDEVVDQCSGNSMSFSPALRQLLLATGADGG